MVTLKSVLRLNAGTCVIFGSCFVMYPGVVAEYLSPQHTAPSIFITLLGAGLIINAMYLIYVSMKQQPAKLEILQFAVGDIIWTVATVALIISKVWITTVDGIAIALLVGLMTGVFGIVQITKVNDQIKHAQ